MLFIAKLLSALLMPLGLSLMVVLLGCGLMIAGRRRAATALIICTVVTLWLASTGFVSNALLAWEEDPFAPQAISALPNADAIVLLGGGVFPSRYPEVGQDLNSAGDRVLHAARLYRAGKAPIVLATGGSLPWSGRPPEAEAMKVLLIEWGVPPSALILEAKSANTHDNAVTTKETYQKRNWQSILLVTSALHMRRSLAAFQALNITAIPAPTDFRRGPPGVRTVLDFLPSVGALDVTTAILWEYLGYEYYRLRGWIG